MNDDAKYLDDCLRLRGGVSSDPDDDRAIRNVLDALAARERELAEARADLAAVEAVGKLVQATPGAFVQKAHVGYDGLLLAVWQDETRFDVIESAPTLVALGRALLAREADDATQ